MKEDNNPINWYKKYHRLVNYISVIQLYLQDNFFLEDELKSEHIKPRILGHWGTVPGINFIYGALNYLVSKKDVNMMLVNGPGHGAPAILANLLAEGTLAEFYPEITPDAAGIGKLAHQFSWPMGFPSHTYPGVPGTILEGGELGYSLGVAFGTVFDNPGLITACIIGDGEAETGTLAASWHSIKFINPRKDGAVLPILHLNGYKISGPAIFGTMSRKEINHYFLGHGYEPIWVDQYEAIDVYIDMLEALIRAYHKIEKIKSGWDTYEIDQPAWPVIIVKTKKGWTGPKGTGEKKIEDNNLSHGIPIKNPKKDEKELKLLNDWLKSYKITELLASGPKKIKEEAIKYVPKGQKRIGINKHTFGGRIRKALKLANIEDHAVRVYKRGLRPESSMLNISEYFRDTFEKSKDDNNFRIFSPDESESNFLEPMFATTNRRYIWPVRKWDKYISDDGRILEMLNEQVLMSWMQGYTLTGRHSVMVSYEAFLNIIISQVQQYIKFLTKSKRHKWREPLAGLNMISTSTTWRQDHNGFSHQNPSLINALLSMHSGFVSVYFPPDVNTMLATMEDSLKRTNSVNLIISGKRELPQWLRMAEAKEHVRKGISIWHWVGSEKPKEEKENETNDARSSQTATNNKKSVDVVLASSGDYQTQEVLAAASILKNMIPELKFRYVNVNELTTLGMGDEKSPKSEDSALNQIFTKNRPVIFSFHGYPEVIKQLTWGHDISRRMTILGYVEEGTTTTPFDMQVQNKTSRYHVCIEAIKAAAQVNKTVKDAEADLLYYFERKLREHNEYIIQYGDDLPEVKEWKWE